MAKSPRKVENLDGEQQDEGPQDRGEQEVLLQAILDDLPEHGRAGSYQPAAVDRWASEMLDLPDGDHDALGWRFTVQGGLLRLAVPLSKPAVA